MLLWLFYTSIPLQSVAVPTAKDYGEIYRELKQDGQQAQGAGIHHLDIAINDDGAIQQNQNANALKPNDIEVPNDIDVAQAKLETKDYMDNDDFNDEANDNDKGNDNNNEANHDIPDHKPENNQMYKDEK